MQGTSWGTAMWPLLPIKHETAWAAVQSKLALTHGGIQTYGLERLPHLLSESSADGSQEQGREPSGQEGRVAKPLEPGGGGPRYQPRGMGSWYLFPAVQMS